MIAAQNRVIFHHDMSRQPGVTGHDDVIAENAVMRDVDVGEEKIVRADHGGIAVVGGAMNRDAFAKHIAVADLQPRDAAFPFQVLRLLAEGGERENFILLAELRVAVNDDVRMQLAIVAERDVFADDAIRADFAAGDRSAPWDG